MRKVCTAVSPFKFLLITFKSFIDYLSHRVHFNYHCFVSSHSFQYGKEKSVDKIKTVQAIKDILFYLFFNSFNLCIEYYVQSFLLYFEILFRFYEFHSCTCFENAQMNPRFACDCYCRNKIAHRKNVKFNDFLKSLRIVEDVMSKSRFSPQIFSGKTIWWL